MVVGAAKVSFQRGTLCACGKTLNLHQAPVGLLFPKCFQSIYPKREIMTPRVVRGAGVRKRRWSKSPYSNPLDVLQPLSQIPVIPEDKHLFKPTIEEVILLEV